MTNSAIGDQRRNHGLGSVIQSLPSMSIDSLIIGISPAIQRLRTLVTRIAHSPLPVLIQGPTGAGKELVARAIHTASQRTGQFVPFNVSAIPDTMFADALFGHVRGAFTNAMSPIPGYLREAHQGTVFLDEIGGLSLPNQMTLLRALETQVYRPIGATKDQASDFRVVSATNDNLRERVGSRGFRGDLLYRLCAHTIEVPALKDRSEDIPVLAQHFAVMACEPWSHIEFTPAALRELQRYEWPGNVRELRHMVAAIGYLADTPIIDAPVVTAVLPSPSQSPSEIPGVSRSDLIAVLHTCDNDINAVATHYGKTKSTIYRWLHACGIPTPERRSARHRVGHLDQRVIPGTDHSTDAQNQ